MRIRSIFMIVFIASSTFASSNFSLSISPSISYCQSGPLFSLSADCNIYRELRVNSFCLDAMLYRKHSADTTTFNSFLFGFSFYMGFDRFFPNFSLGPTMGMWTQNIEDAESGFSMYFGGGRCDYEIGNKLFFKFNSKILLGINFLSKGTSWFGLGVLAMVGLGVGYKF